MKRDRLLFFWLPLLLSTVTLLAALHYASRPAVINGGPQVEAARAFGAWGLRTPTTGEGTR